jgi:formylglycine-generating enzyme required for sulfatase activity
MLKRPSFKIRVILFSLLFLAGCSLFGGGSSAARPLDAIPPEPARNTDGADTKPVPGGTYLLGSSNSDAKALPHEQPMHKVWLTGFNIYTHEVTNGMYKDCVTAKACISVTDLRPDLADYFGKSTYDRFPVVGVDWNMAKSYCEWAGGRLPTEAEWEAAARGADERSYPWGNTTPDCDRAALKSCTEEMLPFEVGTFASGNSPFGVWDMAGNVWEWVSDWYDANYYATDPAVDPQGPWGGQFKVIRGGGWNSVEEKLRSAARLAVDPLLSFKDVGFRCVANPFPGTSASSHPNGGHAACLSATSLLEDESGLCTEGSVYWGIPTTGCAGADRVLLQVAVRNSYGGAYSATMNGSPLSCSYTSGILSCQANRLPAGSEEYEFQVGVTDATGAPLLGYGLSFHLAGNAFDYCSGVNTVEVAHTEAVECDNPPAPGRHLLVNVPGGIRFSQAYLGDALLRGCTARDAFTIFCPVAGSFSAGPDTIRVVGTLLDGVTPVDFTGAVDVADCTYPADIEEATITATATCNGNGGYAVDIRFMPTSINIVRVLLTGMREASCSLPEAGHIACSAGVGDVISSSSGNILPIYLWFDPPIALAGNPVAINTDLAPIASPCAGGSTPSGDIAVGNVTCNPDGGGIFLDAVTDPGASSVSWTSAGVSHACGADVLNPDTWHCAVPLPLPGDLEFCSGSGARARCQRFPGLWLMVPERCGGSPGTTSSSWSISNVACMERGGNFTFRVNYPAGMDGAGVRVLEGSFRFDCTNVPAENYLDCYGPPVPAPTVLHVTYPGGSRDFPEWASLEPRECPRIPSTSSWSISNVNCMDTGGLLEFRINYPPGTIISALFVRDSLGTSYTCEDRPASNFLLCYGPAITSPATLVVSLGEGNQYFDEWRTIAPRFCPTAKPPPAGQPPASGPSCEDQKTQDDCKMFGGCYWWSGGGCHSDPEPQQPPPPPGCDTYGDEKACTTNGCKWDPYAKPPCY